MPKESNYQAPAKYTRLRQQTHKTYLHCFDYIGPVTLHPRNGKEGRNSRKETTVDESKRGTAANVALYEAD